jgi:hypothetical protein
MKTTLEEMRAQSRSEHEANLAKINQRIEMLREIRRQQNIELMKVRQANRTARRVAEVRKLGEQIEKLASL